jgi:hypothetical protein
VPVKVLEQLRAKLETHEFANAQQARRWLKKAHGIDRPYASVWNWLKKCGGVLRVPRPSHSKKKPGAEQEFKEALGVKLEALGLEPGSRVKVWIMDEARFGLHTALRRVWTVRGKRPVVSRQIKYQWDYLYGALSLIGGEAHFAHVPGVGLDWDESYLRDLVATAPEVTHVLVRDQAGFHLRDGDPRLPAQVRVIDLPPYCPELNPCEQLWDIPQGRPRQSSLPEHPKTPRRHEGHFAPLLGECEHGPEPHRSRLVYRSTKRFAETSTVILI